MVLNKNKDLKLYYSISEIAQMFDINESTLRFWEKEFDIIQPRRNKKGVRFYKEEDIENIRLIYHFVKERGMSLAGARQILKNNKSDSEKETVIVDRLKRIKTELLRLKEELDNFEMRNNP